MSLADMRKELRDMRKDTVKPVSRMKKSDISAEIQRLRGMREETPLPAATPSSGNLKSKGAVANIKKAKEAEFPTVPGDKEMPSKAAKSGKVTAAPKEQKMPDQKMSKRDMLKMILEGLGDDS
jgi:hypothetical protein